MPYEGQLTTSFSDREITPKLWGWEDEIVNTPRYCGKILHLNPGFQSSLHYHEYKDETYLCVDGLVLVEHGDKITVLRGWALDTLRIPPGTPHRFRALDRSATIVEFSTTHSDADVVRLEVAREL